MKFLHSMIRVKDENASIKFYCDFLGLQKGKRLRLDDCYLQYLTDSTTGVEIELTINDKKQEYKTGSAFGHFAFECDNIDKIKEKMDKMGYGWEVEPFKLDCINSIIAFILDPDGNEIELIQKL